MKVHIEMDAGVTSIAAAVSICCVLQRGTSPVDDNFELIDALAWLFTLLESDWDMAQWARESPEDARVLIPSLRSIADDMEQGLS